jgi:hypothetical protein
MGWKRRTSQRRSERYLVLKWKFPWCSNEHHCWHHDMNNTSRRSFECSSGDGRSCCISAGSHDLNFNKGWRQGPVAPAVISYSWQEVSLWCSSVLQQEEHGHRFMRSSSCYKCLLNYIFFFSLQVLLQALPENFNPCHGAQLATHPAHWQNKG